MISYLVKSACCAVIFLLVYRFFLEKEKMHRFNRMYLLFSVALSFIIPVILIPLTSEALPSLEEALPVIFIQETQQQAEQTTGASIPVATTTIFSVQNILLALYIITTLILLVRFCINLYKLVSAYATNQIVFHEGARLVIVRENISSYTFLNTIFISKRDYTEPDSEILRHELAHVRQKHSLDILFIELIRNLFWFNPVYIFYKRSIQLNHEFLADEAVIQHCANPAAYQHLLLDRISLASNLSLSSRFNYSITKKRLQMMTQKASQARALLKQVSLVPVFIACFIAFGTRDALSTPVKNPGAILQGEPVRQTLRDTPKVTFKAVLTLTKDVPHTKEGISEEEFNRYKEMEKKYITPGKSHRANGEQFQKLTEDKADLKLLQDIYFKMSREQQAKANIVFMKKSGPRKKEPPTQAQIDKWKSPNLYGIWIDEKKVSNDELNKYTAADFSLYDASKLHGAARKNVKYQVQVDIMTNSYYEDYRKKTLQNIKENPYHVGLFFMAREK